MTNVLHGALSLGCKKWPRAIPLLLVTTLTLGCARNNTERVVNGTQAPPGSKFTSCQWSDSTVVAEIETENGDRTVRLAWKPGGLKGLATISDMDNNVLFSISVRFIEADSSLTICEQTSTDVFCMKERFSSDAQEHIETFTQNGQSLTVTYPNIDLQTMTEGYENYLVGHSEELDPQYLAALQAFSAFYDANSSLNNNEDGIALVQAVYDIAAQARTAARAGSQQPSISRDPVAWICGFVGIAGGIKCIASLGINPVCWGATIFTFGCVFFYIFGGD